jgi:hypothetical protein
MKIKHSEYKGVSKVRSNGKYDTWCANSKHNGINCTKHCKTERQAAIAYDKMMIEQGREPVNILVRK